MTYNLGDFVVAFYLVVVIAFILFVYYLSKMFF